MESPFPAPLSAGTGPKDRILVQRACLGEPGAVSEVLHRLACIVRFVYRLNRVLGYGLPVESLEDVTQEVYTSVWTRLPDFSGAAALESWVYGFCRNCLRAAARKRARSLEREAHQEGIEPLEMCEASDSFDLAAQREAKDVILEELSRLDPSEREVVTLRHLQDVSFEQIARHLGLPPSTVKDRCYRAMSKLKARLKRRDVNA